MAAFPDAPHSPAAAASARLSRRRLLQLGAVAGLGLLAGCRREGPRLLSARGELPAAWTRRMPATWGLESFDGPDEVLSAAAASSAALLQLSDGWAGELDHASLQPVGSEALQARLVPLSRPVSRLFAAEGAPRLAFPWSCSPWVLLLRNRSDLVRRRVEGWNLLLDPSLRGRLVLPSSPRLAIALVEGDPVRLRRLRAQALAYDDRDGLSLLLAGDADALVLPRRRVVPLLQRDPRLAALLPESGSPLAWSLLLRPAAGQPEPPLDWLAEVLEPPLLPKLLAAGWVPPLPRDQLLRASAAFPPALRALLVPPAAVMERCRDLLPLSAAQRTALQQLWDDSAP
jgi:putative spermidine/putrescine transport system substrate-binding protein